MVLKIKPNESTSAINANLIALLYNLLTEMKMDNKELCKEILSISILQILLDNAINACKNSPLSKITSKIKIRGSELCFMMLGSSLKYMSK